MKRSSALQIATSEREGSHELVLARNANAVPNIIAADKTNKGTWGMLPKAENDLRPGRFVTF